MVLGYTCLELFNVISDICTNRRRRIVVCQAMELVGGSLVPPLGRGLASRKKLTDKWENRMAMEFLTPITFYCNSKFSLCCKAFLHLFQQVE